MTSVPTSSHHMKLMNFFFYKIHWKTQSKIRTIIKKKNVDGEANPRQPSKVSITKSQKDVNRVGVPSPRVLRCRTQQTPRAPCRDHIFASVCTDRSETRLGQARHTMIFSYQSPSQWSFWDDVDTFSESCRWCARAAANRRAYRHGVSVSVTHRHAGVSVVSGRWGVRTR